MQTMLVYFSQNAYHHIWKMDIRWYYHYHYLIIIIIIIIVIIITYCVLEENDLSSSIVYKFMFFMC